MIEILDYDRRWPMEFAAIGQDIRLALGDIALRIDHVGSTSVPGLAAKNIIDVQITVRSIEPDALFATALEAAGYMMRREVTRDHRPPGIEEGGEADWEKRFFKPPEGWRPTNIHVRAQGRANQRYALLFRDYLRSDPRSAAAYAEVKRRLAHYHPNDLSAYVTVKDPVCDIIIAAADAWALTTGWQPGPPDA